MSDLQDKLDRGEITPQEYHDRWVAEMEENEQLRPGFHDRLYEYLMAKYPVSVLMRMSSFDRKFGGKKEKRQLIRKLALVR
jgi:hypothetical protein